VRTLKNKVDELEEWKKIVVKEILGEHIIAELMAKKLEKIGFTVFTYKSS